MVHSCDKYQDAFLLSDLVSVGWRLSPGGGASSVPRGADTPGAPTCCLRGPWEEKGVSRTELALSPASLPEQALRETSASSSFLGCAPPDFEVLRRKESHEAESPWSPGQSLPGCPWCLLSSEGSAAPAPPGWPDHPPTATQGPRQGSDRDLALPGPLAHRQQVRADLTPGLRASGHPVRPASRCLPPALLDRGAPRNWFPCRLFFSFYCIRIF